MGACRILFILVLVYLCAHGCLKGTSQMRDLRWPEDRAERCCWGETAWDLQFCTCPGVRGTGKNHHTGVGVHKKILC